MQYYWFLILNILISSMLCAQNQSWAEKTLTTMSLREKIGQLFMVATCANLHMHEETIAKAILESPYLMNHDYIEKLIKEYHIGGLIFLYKQNINQQIMLTNLFQKISTIPLLIGQDAEWGLGMRLYDGISFPRNMTLGAIQDESLIYDLGYEIGRQCKKIGVHINFAPVIDINTNPENPIIHMRSFGDDKKRVAQYGILLMQGMQDAGILACGKHFTGHGNTYTDSHAKLPLVLQTREELYENEFYPFKQLINAGIAAIMTAHLKIPALDSTPYLPSSLSYPIVTDLLKKELGFSGLVVTDGMGMKGITKYHKPGYAEFKAFLAGADIILCPLDVPKTVALIEQAIEDKVISEEELNQRVLKILKAKERMNVHTSRFVDNKNTLVINTFYAHQLKQALFNNATSVVTDEQNLIPLASKKYDDSVLIQIGGTIPSEFEKILKSAMNIPSFHISTDMPQQTIDYVMQKINNKKTIIIALLGMNQNIKTNFGIHEKTHQFINDLKNKGKKIIITIFGSPYSLRLFEKENILLLAYENDPEAQRTAAHVILGNQQALGKLPVNTKFFWD
ncbi:MAG: glycoside hydrolase family 3 N-terminal domain-containing protein [Candidatus Babeliales bacterium]